METEREITRSLPMETLWYNAPTMLPATGRQHRGCIIPQVLHRERSSGFSFNFPFRLFFLLKSSSYLRLLPRLPVSLTLPSLYLSFNIVF